MWIFKIKFKLDFQNVDFDNNHTLNIDIMSEGQFTNHTFVVFRNMTSDQQIFYAFGRNRDQQQGYKSEARQDRVACPTVVNSLNILFKFISL